MSRSRSSQSQIDSNQDKSYCVIADFFLSLSDPTALKVLSIVRRKEMTSHAISQIVEIELDTILAKLKAMERDGILVSFVRSQKNLYRVADSHILKAFDRILELSLKTLKRTGSTKKDLSGATQKGKKYSNTGSVTSIRQTH